MRIVRKTNIMSKQILLFPILVSLAVLIGCTREIPETLPIIEDQFIHLVYQGGESTSYQALPRLENNSYLSQTSQKLLLQRHLEDDSDVVLIVAFETDQTLELTPRGTIDRKKIEFPLTYSNVIVARFPDGIDNEAYDCEQSSFYEISIDSWDEEFIMTGTFRSTSEADAAFCLESGESPENGSFSIYVQPYEL